MAVIEQLSEEECYLVAILLDDTGIDLAEFAWVDEERPDGVYRLWDYQWPWFSCQDEMQADSCGRAVGKTQRISMRAFAFPFNYPGREMLVTAPELNHLQPLTDKIEGRILGSRFGREMILRKKGQGIKRQPHWTARFANGAVINSRLPGRDGKGVKGQHSVVIELDEAQDYPKAGWTEIIEARNSWSEGSKFLAHGVAKGTRDDFYDISQPGSGWTVHQIMGMQRPTWDEQEREGRITQYGGSRANPDYKRNIYGEHGDLSNAVFVLARLMDCVDQVQGSEYNTDVYLHERVSFEQLRDRKAALGGDDEAATATVVAELVDRVPGTHAGWGQGRAKVEYGAYYGGMDVGLTNHPSEILIAGERKDGQLDILLRVTLERIEEDVQRALIRGLFERYGRKLLRFGIDRGGLGFPIYQSLVKEHGEKRVWGWTFDERVPVDFEDRELEDGETQEDLVVERRFVEHATDVLRSDYVDRKRILLPWDREMLGEFQGQTYRVVKSAGNPYGKRSYSKGGLHTLDAAKVLVAAVTLPQVYEVRDTKPVNEPVMDRFVGGW